MGDGVSAGEADQFGTGVAGVGESCTQVGVASRVGRVGDVVAADGRGVSGIRFSVFGWANRESAKARKREEIVVH